MPHLENYADHHRRKPISYSKLFAMFMQSVRRNIAGTRPYGANLLWLCKMRVRYEKEHSQVKFFGSHTTMSGAVVEWSFHM